MSGVKSGWYYAEGDPIGTQRYWDGAAWVGESRRGGRSHDARRGTPADGVARVLARGVDLIVWLIISVVVHALLSEPLIRGGSGAKWWLAGVITLICIGTYEVLLPLTKGGTLGKLAMGIGIVSDNGGGALYQQSALVRAAPILLAAVPLFGGYLIAIVAAVSLGLIFTDARARSLWDRMAKTVVVRN